MSRLSDSMSIGTVYGRLTVISDAGRDRGHDFWMCRCQCGTERKVSGSHLRRGAARSCGCLRDELAKQQPVTHGRTRRGQHDPVYHVWSQMIQRCHNPRNKSYDRYGGRGIAVCERWRQSFEAFIADMGERPDGLTLERKDNDGNYEPGNVRWATPLEQTFNRRPRLRPAPVTPLQEQALTDLAQRQEWATMNELKAAGITRQVLHGMVPKGWIERKVVAAEGTWGAYTYRITDLGRTKIQQPVTVA